MLIGWSGGKQVHGVYSKPEVTMRGHITKTGAWIDKSVLILRQGGALAEKAGATMTHIVKGARAVDEIMARLAAASDAQGRLIEQVRQTVGRIDQTGEQQELLAHAVEATESMRRQSQELIEAVSVFRLNEFARIGTYHGASLST